MATTSTKRRRKAAPCLTWDGPHLAGIDEAGYGCLAGPVSVGIAVLKPGLEPGSVTLHDSKRTKTHGHAALAEGAKAACAAYAVVFIHPVAIDKPGARSKSCLLSSKMQGIHYGLDAIRGVLDKGAMEEGYEIREVEPLEDAAALTHLIMDGNYFSPEYPGLEHECIEKADATHASVAAASLIAKDYRDRYMVALTEEHPVLEKDYNMAVNVGYWRADHAKAVETLGYTAIHRRTYKTCAASFPRGDLGAMSGLPLPEHMCPRK